MPIRSFLAGQAFGAEIISEIEYGAQGAPGVPLSRSRISLPILNDG